MSSLIPNPDAGYQFLRGIDPYSSGVIAETGFEIVHVTLSGWLPWDTGLAAARRYVQSLGLHRKNICAVELRCPQPHSMGGFVDFNRDYRALLQDWGMLVDGLNPVARTNVSPVVGAPDETVLHAFSYVRPGDLSQQTFVVAGGGELPHRELDRKHIVRLGESSADAMSEKAQCVIDIMLHRLRKLNADSSLLSAIDVYTAYPLQQILSDVIIPELPPAAAKGVNWFYSRPPIQEIEFEMDMRGVVTEEIITLC